MAHGVEVSSDKISSNVINKSNSNSNSTPTKIVQQQKKSSVTGSRRIFPAHFKIMVLDSYRNDKDCIGNQRATARKYGIHRRQIQKWLQCEQDLRNNCANSNTNSNSNSNIPINGTNTVKVGSNTGVPALNLSLRLTQDTPSSYSPLLVNYDNKNNNNNSDDSNKCIGYDNNNQIYHHRYYPIISDNKSDRVSPDSTSFDNYIGSRSDYIGSESRSNIIGSDSNEINSNCDKQLESKLIGSECKFSSIKNLIELETDKNVINSDSNSSFIRSNVNGIGSNSEYQFIGSNLDSNRIGSNLTIIGSNQDYHQISSNPMDYNYNVIKSESNYQNSIDRIPINSIHRIIRLDTNFNGIYMDGSNRIGSELDSTSESGSHSPSDSDDPLDCSLELPTQEITRRRSFPLAFKLMVLDSYHNHDDNAGNQRATARRFRINRRQVQKWLAQENELRQEVSLHQGETRQRLAASEPVDLRTYYEYSRVTCPQDRPLCLVKPKSNLPKPKKDYISFKPYLDNPVVKPDEQRNENNCYCVPLPHWRYSYPESSAFVRYPAYYI